jgi:hypothetical protein
MNAIAQRLLAETSPWFKKAQVYLVIILAIVNGLQMFIPAGIVSHANWIGIALIIFCSFTVNDATLLLNNGLNMQTVFSMVVALPDQLEQLKGAVDGKLTLEQAKQLAGLQVTNPVIPAVPAPTPEPEAAAV